MTTDAEIRPLTRDQLVARMNAIDELITPWEDEAATHESDAPLADDWIEYRHPGYRALEREWRALDDELLRRRCRYAPALDAERRAIR